jgi:hypothetical protein
MKILFCCATNSAVNFPNSPNLHEGESNDYLTDGLFYYVKNNSNYDVYECPWMAHMYKNSPSDRKLITRGGFGIRKEIEKTPNILSVNDTIKMIEDKFFDIIITDARTMSEWWHNRGISPFYNNAIKIRDCFLKCYPKNKIIFLDGDDQQHHIYREFYGNSLYFKRELAVEDKELIPIGYCFPEDKFRKLNNFQEKNKIIATCIPGVMNTYIFNDSNSYYEDYRTSLFGLTWKKLGWDCFRHHEILFSSCIPIFPDIEDCPSLTMTHYPKELCKEILKSSFLKDSRHEKYCQHWDLYAYRDVRINLNLLSKEQYDDYLGRFTEHALNNLTSKKMFEYILKYATI